MDRQEGTSERRRAKEIENETQNRKIDILIYREKCIQTETKRGR